MKFCLRKLSLILISVILAVVSLACACKPEEGPDPIVPSEPTEYTLKLVTNEAEGEITITKEAGEDLSGLLPAYSDTDEYYFGGWYTTKNFVGEASALPDKMPASNLTYYAQWYRTYRIEKYLQKVDLAGYEEKALDTVEGKVVKGESLPGNVTRFLQEDPAGFAVHVEGEYSDEKAEAAKRFELTGKDNTLALRYDRKSYKIIFDANLGSASVIGEMESVTVVYGQTYELGDCGFSAPYRMFACWASDAEGQTEITSVTMPASDVTVYAVWERGLVDLFDGYDSVFLPRKEPGKAYLQKNGFDGLIEGVFDEATGIFDFGKDGTTILSGRVADSGRTAFFYFKDLWQKQYTSPDGQTLELKTRGEAVLTDPSGSQNGTYTVDFETGLFSLTVKNVTRLFDVDPEEGTFRFSGKENGWYGLSLGEDSYGYDLMYLDGFGRLAVYALSPYDENFSEYFDVYTGSYELGEDGVHTAYYQYGAYSYSFPFKLTDFTSPEEFEGVTLRGKYLFGDYRGRFTNLDNEYEYFELDGFGRGNYKGEEGSYTIEEDSWLVDNYPSPETYFVTNVHFVSDDKRTDKLFSIYGDEVYLEITEKYGRYEFTQSPTSIYPGSTGEEAFLYLYGYSLYGMYGDVNFAKLWFGNYTPKYSIMGYEEEDLPLYSWRDDGMVIPTEKEGTYRYVSVYEDIEFEFSITEDGKVLWQISDVDEVLYEENGEKIYIDRYGVAYHEKDGVKTEVAFGTLNFMRSETLAVGEQDDFTMLALYSFLIEGEYRSFVYYAKMESVYDAEGQFSSYKKGERIDEVKEVSFVATMGQFGLMIVYPDHTADLGLDLTLYGASGYWFPMTGTLTESDGGYLLKVDGEVPKGSDEEETELYKTIYDLFNDYKFKIGIPESGIYACLEWNGLVLEITDPELGTLKTDGFGIASFDGFENCVYSILSEADSQIILNIYYQYEGSEEFISWYLIVDKNAKTMKKADNFPGTFYTFDLSTGEVSASDLLTLDGAGHAVGYYHGYVFEGSYSATGEEYETDGMLCSEFKITIDYFGGENAPKELYVILAYLSEEAHIGIFYLREDTSAGNFVILEDGEPAGYIESTGYGSALLVLDGGQFSAEMHLGNFADSYRTNENGEREFSPDVNGSVVLLFVTYDMFNSFELIFDILPEEVDGERCVSLRDRQYGCFLEYGEDGGFGDQYILLDGHGKAEIRSCNDDKVLSTYQYELMDEELAAFRLFDESGETVFMFNVTITPDSGDLDENYGYVYTYHLYNESLDNVYVTEDWEVLILNGYGYAAYFNKYGEVTDYEYLVLNEKELMLRPYFEGRNLYVSLEGKSFSFIVREFIVNEEGVLLAYNGEGGEISLPDEVKRIPAGVFNGVELTHVNFNQVEIVDANAFGGQPLDGLYAPCLKTIGERAFANMGGYDFEVVDLPAAVEIGEAAFIGNTYLERVILRDIVRIGEQAFAGCGSYSGFVVDMRLCTNPGSVSISDSAFLALNTDKFFILVNGVETLNQVITGGAWSQKALRSVCIWQSKESYKSDLYLVANDGSIYKLSHGVMTRSYKEDGETKSEVFAVYEFDAGETEDEDGTKLSVYVKQGETYDTQAVTAETSACFVLVLKGSVAFSETSYGEYHTLTDEDQNVKFTLSYAYYSDRVEFTEFYYNETEASDVTFADGKIGFSIGADRYSVTILSGKTCKIDKVGTAEEIEVTYKDVKYLFTLVADGGKVKEVLSVETENSYGGYNEESVYACSILDNVIDIVLGTDQRKEYQVTYCAGDSAQASLSMRFVKTYLRFENYNYAYPTYLNVSVELDENDKITNVTEFSFVEGYGGVPEPLEFTVTCNEDGTATIMTQENGSFKISVSYDYRYELEVTRV